MFTLNKSAIALSVMSAMLTLSSCATQDSRFEKVGEESSSIVNKTIQDNQPLYGLRKVSSVADLPGGFAVKASEGSGRGSTSVNASGSLSEVLKGVVGNQYSLNFVSGLDASKPVSVSVKNMSLEAVVRQIAANAGYVAITNESNRSITIADQGVWTFRIPVRLMQKLAYTYSVGGSAAGGASGGASSSSSGSSSSSSSGQGAAPAGVQTSFTASQSSLASTGGGAAGGFGGAMPKDGLSLFLSGVAGDNANVSVSPDTGYVMVRGNGVALERIHRFMNQFVYDNNRRVDIKLSVIEGSLTDSMQYGIDWTRILSPVQNSSLTATLSGAASTVLNPSLSLNYTTASITSVIQAIQKYANVSVVTQPSITAMNRTPVAIFDGTSVPYLGSVMSTSTQVSTSSSGSLSFASSGVSLSILPDIMSDNEAQITLAPQITDSTKMDTFTLNGNTLTAPESPEKRILMQTIVKNGQTVILGGIKTNQNNKSKSSLPFMTAALGQNNVRQERELVILMQSTVIAPTHNETLVAESL
jgi:MSHA biogenesis protein MshL